MGDQPPTNGTTASEPSEFDFVKLVTVLKDDKQREALERYLTSQVADQPRAVKELGQSVISLAQSTGYFGPDLRGKIVKFAQELEAPVDRARAISTPKLPSVAATAGADPVELATGQLVYSHTDLSLSGAGIEFEFARTYRSQARYPNGPLGACWDHSYNLWLRVIDPNLIAVGNGQLHEDRYRLYSPGGTEPDYFATDAGNANILLLNPKTQKYELHVPGGITHQFEPLSVQEPGLHRLQRTFDRYQRRNAISGEPEPPGNYLAFSYDLDETHLLREIEVNHPTRKVVLNYDDLGRLIGLNDYAGREVVYTYDEFDDLVAVTLPASQDRPFGRSTFYEYSSASSSLMHLLTSVTDADGRRYLDVEYGLEDGFTSRQRVIRQRDDEGEWSLDYADLDATKDPNSPPDPDLPVRYTCLTQPNGHQVEYWFNELGNALFKKETYLDSDRVPQTALWRYQHNPDGKLIASLSPEGIFSQWLHGRDDYALANACRVADPLAALPTPTAAQRQSFETLRATVRRAAPPATLSTWPDPAIADAILASTKDDIIQLFVSDPLHQLPLRTSDPRTTNDLVSPPGRWAKIADYSADQYQFLLSTTYPATTRPDGTTATSAQELFTSDAAGRVTDHRDAEGHVTHNEYFQDTDPALPWDDRFGVGLVVQPDPVRATGFLRTTTAGWGDANAATTVFTVNRRGLWVETVNSRGATVSRVIDTIDKPVSVTRSPKAGVNYTTRHRYTGQAKVARTETPIIDDNGASILVDGVALGTAVHRTRYTDTEQVRSEAVGGLDPGTFLTSRTVYDGALVPTRQYSPGNALTVARYDARRLLVYSAQGYRSQEPIETKSFYDRDGRLIASVDGRGAVKRFEYDAFGRKAREIEVADRALDLADDRPFDQRFGHTRLFTYDKLDNVIQERFFQWLPGDKYQLLSRTRLEFDERGRKIKEIYDLFPTPADAGAAGLIAFENGAPPGSKQIETWLTLDANGQAIERREGVVVGGTDPCPGSQLKATYDYAGRRVRSQTLLPEQGGLEISRTESTYDSAGNLARSDQIDSEYDDNFKLIGTEVISSAAEFDLINQKTAEIDGLGNRTQHRYDSRGLLFETSDPLGNVTRLDYDLYGRKTRVLQSSSPLRMVVSSYEFDKNSQITRIGRFDETNAALTNVRYVYNAAQRKTAEILEPGTAFERQSSWKYDGAGNVVEQLTPSGLKIITTYDHAGRVQQLDFDDAHLGAGEPPIGGARVEQFTRDGLGRIVNADTDGGLTSVAFTYDSLGRPRVESQTVRGEVSLSVAREFNSLGLRTNLTYPSKRSVEFEFDLGRRLIGVENRSLGVPNTGSPTAGASLLRRKYVGARRRSDEHASGVKSARAYDADARLIGVNVTATSGTSLLNLVSLFDAAHNVKADWQGGGSALTPLSSYTHDGLNRMIAVGSGLDAMPDVTALAPPSASGGPLGGQGSIDAKFPSPSSALEAFDYDAGGNRTAELVSGLVTPVDALDRLNSNYDSNGNSLAFGLASLQFDGRNRLVSWDVGGKAVTALYDALGRRVRIQADDGSSRRFAYDGASSVAEYRGGSLFSESVVTEPPDGRSILFSGGDDLDLHSDRVGSVRLVTDAAGMIVGRYDFSPYGRLRAGGTVQPDLSHLFMGREWDEDLELYHFRARHYDPDSGRFVQRDPDTSRPWRSAYAAFGGNPLIFIDPMGTSEKQASAPRRQADVYEIGVIKADDSWHLSDWNPFDPTKWRPMEIRDPDLRVLQQKRSWGRAFREESERMLESVRNVWLAAEMLGSWVVGSGVGARQAPGRWVNVEREASTIAKPAAPDVLPRFAPGERVLGAMREDVFRANPNLAMFQAEQARRFAMSAVKDGRYLNTIVVGVEGSEWMAMSRFGAISEAQHANLATQGIEFVGGWGQGAFHPDVHMIRLLAPEALAANVPMCANCVAQSFEQITGYVPYTETLQRMLWQSFPLGGRGRP